MREVKKSPGIRDLTLVSDEEPRAAEQMLEFGFVHVFARRRVRG